MVTAPAAGTDPLAGGQPPQRVVMYVRNDVTHDARVLREAAALAATGRRVTIIGRLPERPGVPELEQAGAVTIVRVREDTAWRAEWRETLAEIRAPWRARRRIAHSLVGRGGTSGSRGRAARDLAVGVVAFPWVLYRVFDRMIGGRLPAPLAGGELDRFVRWRGDATHWAAIAAASAPPADVHHGHDLIGLLAARQAARRDHVPFIYDSHDLASDATSMATRAALVRAWVRRVERQAARGAAAVVTVNDGLAGVLRRRLRPEQVVVVHNCPPRFDGPPDGGDGRLRAAAGLAPDALVVLYHGGLMPHRGIEESLGALERPELAGVHAILLGYGPLRESLVSQATDGPLRGRLHLLEPVPPEDLPAWVAEADVGLVAIQPSTLNHRLSTPNKLFDCLAVGTPVVASDFPAMRRIVLGDPDGPLGAVCDPTDAVSIAAAIRSILDLPVDERVALRARVLRAARERWNWETESARLVALYDGLPMETPS